MGDLEYPPRSGNSRPGIRRFLETETGWTLVLADLTGEESNLLFDTLQDWNDQLSHFDLSDQRCDDDPFSP